MNSHVDFKTSFFSETLSTRSACIRLLSSVNSNVLLKVSFMSKNLSTVFAGEIFLFSVNYHVSFKGFILSKTFYTVLAGETSSSCLLSSFSCGSLFSLRTAKTFFFRYEIRIFVNQVLLFIFIQFLTLLFQHLQV